MNFTTTNRPKVMLVDDNEIDNYITKTTITTSGFSDHVILKNSGKSGLDYLLDHKDEVPILPDIIFLDINMLEVSGYEFVNAFDNLPNQIRKKCFIVILTSSSDDEERMFFLESDYVVDFVTKPLLPTDLERIIGMVVKKTKAEKKTDTSVPE